MDYEARDPLFREKIRDLSDNILRHTIQIFRQTEYSDFVAHGSGILFKTENYHYIITAAHVLLHDAKLFTVSSGFITELPGHYQWIVRNNDIDIAYIRLHPSVVHSLGQTYQFISIEMLLKLHQPITTLQYMVTGFPASNTTIKIAQGRIDSFAAHFHLKMSKEVTYQYYGLNSNVQFALDFKGKLEDYQTSNRQKINDPYGISGSGLWKLVQSNEMIKYDLGYKLIGIMTQFRKGKYHCLIANKIELLHQEIVESEDQQESNWI